MPTKPRAPVPPPPFAAFRMAATAQRAGCDGRSGPPPLPILPGAMARLNSAGFAPWPGAAVPSPAAGLGQRQPAAVVPAAVLAPRPPARPGAAATATVPRPQRVAQRAAAPTAAAEVTADEVRRQAGIMRISAVLKLIYGELYPGGTLKLPEQIKSPELLQKYIYKRLSIEQGNPYFKEKIPSLGILLTSDQKNYVVHKQLDEENKKKKKQAKTATGTAAVTPAAPVTDTDLGSTSYYFVDNMHCARLGQSRQGIARRIVVNLQSQAEAMRLATMFIGLFKSLGAPAPASAATTTVAPTAAAAAAPPATAAYPASPKATAVAAKADGADFARYIRQFKVYLGNNHAKEVRPELVGIKRDKLVVYYDYMAGPGGIDWVGNAIVNAIRATGVKLERNLAPFYAMIAPGLAWAEEPKHFRAEADMQQSFTDTRASVIQGVIMANPKIPSFPRFVQLVVAMFRCYGIDIHRTHRHG